MREFETSVQELKHDVLTSVARLAWGERLQTGLLDIAEQIIPGPEAKMRCCIYKERAIINDRVKVAMGGDRTNPCMVEVLPVACDECPVNEITVGPACRGCIATRCVHACPTDAITVTNHRAQIDHSKCITCGKCITACPYSAIDRNVRPCERGCPVNAISMREEDKKASIDPDRCISCGICTNQCPFGAIMDKSYLVDVIQLLRSAIRWDYHVYAVLAPSIAGQFAPASLGQVVAGLRQLGFYDVMEVALGADMVAAEESEELVEKGLLASSCCPAFVEYIEKHVPEAVPLVSHTPSPMVMIGKYIKERDPKAKVVFVGPCVAKKKECGLGKTMGIIDYSLTFEELYPLFVSRDIDIESLEPGELDNASGYGRGFAASGGVAAAVRRALQEKERDFELKPVPCSGIKECKVALIKAAKGVLDGNFIEGMACEGGCVMGPSQLMRRAKNKVDLDQHIKQAGRDITGAVTAAREAAL